MLFTKKIIKIHFFCSHCNKTISIRKVKDQLSIPILGKMTDNRLSLGYHDFKYQVTAPIRVDLEDDQVHVICPKCKRHTQIKRVYIHVRFIKYGMAIILLLLILATYLFTEHLFEQYGMDVFADIIFIIGAGVTTRFSSRSF